MNKSASLLMCKVKKEIYKDALEQILYVLESDTSNEYKLVAIRKEVEGAGICLTEY